MKTSRRPRTEILAAILAAFAGVQGNLSEEEWALGMAMSDAKYTRRECRNEPHGKRRAKRELARALRRHGKTIVRRAEQFG